MHNNHRKHAIRQTVNTTQTKKEKKEAITIPTYK